MRASGKVIVDDRFRAYTRELQRGIQRSLVEAGTVAVAAARGKSSSYRISGIQQKTTLGSVHRVPGGEAIDVTNPDFRARMFEKGTYQKLGRRLTARSKAGAVGNRGVRPQRFMAAGRRAGKVALVAALRRHLG